MRHCLKMAVVTAALWTLVGGGILAQTGPAMINRIVTDSPAGAEILLALNAAQRVVGTAPAIAGSPLFKILVPAWAGLPSITSGTGLDAAVLAELKPDLAVLQSAAGTDKLAESGIRIIVADVRDYTALIDTIAAVAKQIGAEERGAEIASELQSRLQLARERAFLLPDAEKPSLYLTGPDGLLSAPAADTHQFQMGRLAGGRPVEAALSGGWQQVRPEQLLAWDPEVIVILPYANAPQIEDVMTDPRWRALKAVQAGKVYVMPSAIGGWDQPGPTGILGLMWLVKTLHTDKFLEVEPSVEADAIFRALFNIPFSQLSREDLAPKPAPLPPPKPAPAAPAAAEPGPAGAPVEPAAP